MSNFKMKIYDATFKLTSVVCWANEEEYRLAEKFLTDLGANRDQSTDTGEVKADFYLENRQQFDDFHNFRCFLEKRRPRSSDPPILAMNIYDGTTGVQMTINWADEEEYQEARKFLMDMGVRAFASNDDRQKQPEFFYLENKQQLNALYEFRRSLTEKKN